MIPIGTRVTFVRRLARAMGFEHKELLGTVVSPKEFEYLEDTGIVKQPKEKAPDGCVCVRWDGVEQSGWATIANLEICEKPNRPARKSSVRKA